MTIYHRSVVEMRRNVSKQGKRSVVLRFILAKGDRDKIVAWNQDLVRILHVFNVRSNGFVGSLQTQESILRLNWQLTPT